MKKSPKKRAIALAYDGTAAPQVTARGSEQLAEEIIALAEQHGIPLKEEKELVALLAELDLGEAIPEQLYQAVAEVLAFAYIVTGRFPEGWSPPND